VLLGPVHRVPVRGLALPRATEFITPLGTIPLDAEAMRSVSVLPQVTVSDEAHALEHSLEVHLPFLQTVLGDFKLLPFAVGNATAAEVAEVLERLWGGEETLIVISSDLSHFLSYHVAKQLDRGTVNRILALKPDLDHEQACGATPVNGLLAYAAKHGLEAELRDLRNSGDTAGDKSRVVGYASVAFYESKPAQTGKHEPEEAERGHTLLRTARDAIARHLGEPGVAHESGPWMQAPGASFVTLTQQGNLRGCIGSLEAHRPLVEDVRANAVAAAVHDPRFSPLQARELAKTRIEVSLLSASEPIMFQNEQHVLSLLRPGIDGIVLEYGYSRGTFLPQVWESLPEPADFLFHLKRKAGLPANFWHEDIKLSRYTVTKWKEAEYGT
jgi:AmmeMemoRadiSam system protein A